MANVDNPYTNREEAAFCWRTLRNMAGLRSFPPRPTKWPLILAERQAVLTEDHARVTYDAIYEDGFAAGRAAGRTEARDELLGELARMFARYEGGEVRPLREAL
jgi:hypothetical protein